VNVNTNWSLLLSYGFVGDPKFEMGLPLTEFRLTPRLMFFLDTGSSQVTTSNSRRSQSRREYEVMSHCILCDLVVRTIN